MTIQSCVIVLYAARDLRPDGIQGREDCPALRAFPLLALRRSLSKQSGSMIVVHRKSRSELTTAALARGIEAFDLERFIQDLVRGRSASELRKSPARRN